MNDLIEVFRSNIDGCEVNSVNLRDIHVYLEVGRDFSTWAKNRLEDFTQDIDFIVPQNRGAVLSTTYGQVRIDYIVTLDTAKHICMIERNDKGKELRQYFINCEKKLKTLNQPTNLSPELALFKTMLDSAIALETKQKALEQRTEAIEQKLEATTTKDDECLSSSQIQELESLFKQIFLISKNGQQIGQIKAMLKAKFLKCPASSCTYKDIAQKHYPACKKIVSAFL